ncbi:uncharacterized protein LOC133721263 isoform X1 [Rosa rugosa]|uniref:uncharacterized protein LOC133721263 isoform X1 n=3 Tax=Rosa rugosa TaxID=74645 RepID=UPI002B405FDE|nr:uncharacterized protein LOC133721263 isoform X1 [Rosa rugosa]
MGNSSTDDSASDGDAPVFSEGEKVLSFHNTRICEAKVQKAELRKNEWKYFVHYLGWNKVSWDEWVGVDRLLKHNEENIKKQQALNKKQDIITKSGRLTQMKPKSSTDAKMEKEEQKNNVAEGKKRKNDCGEDTVALGKLVKIQIPSKLRKQVIDDWELASQLDKDILGMDSSQLNEANKKGSRRVWTREEESALLGILEDLVAKNHRHDNGTFKSGALNQVENALHNLFPESGLKAKPHIESKMKILKKQFRIVYEMVNKTGFEWNDEKKCVMVDTEETWKAYLQHHKEAAGWRGKFFPLYDRLGYIFKADCALGERSQNSADIGQELNCMDVSTTDFEIEEDTFPRSVDQVSTNKQTDQSHSSPSKRRRDDDSGGSSQINETNEKNGRHLWTKEEEDAVLGILEDLVAKGPLYDNGTFRSGTFAQIEDALRHLCLASGLKARHIESKVKNWKRKCSIVSDMLNRTGFSWNNVMKCVEVDNGETWKSYVQTHREADKWRGKYFPIFDRLTHIFDVDRATVKTTQARAEIAEEINCFEVNSTDFGIEEGTCPRSVDQLITKQTDHSHSSQRKRRREDDTGGSSHIDETSKRRRRRTWTEEEEDALLGILEDLIAKGHRYEKGTFKPGMSTLIEDALSKLCPASGLKASPHVESKIKKLKQECSIVCDMLNTDGFSWNNEMKCVEVDSETWKRYVQHHKEADKWRGKFFPLFERLIYIFEVGRPIAKTTQTSAEMVEEMNCVEFNTTDFGTLKDACPKAVEQVSTTKDIDQSHSLPSKRREDDMGGIHHINETNRKRRRRKWTKEEEDALLSILEDLVAKGHRFHNKTFRSGTLTLIENTLCNLCPASGLKAYPHVESKIKKLKKGFSTVCDILNSGFGWNDRTKCVVVECEESWKGFVQHHKEAGKWRYRHFPLYDRLAHIFGVDSTNVKASQAHIETVEGINSDEVESGDLGIEEDTNSRSVDRISTNKEADKSHSPQRNSRRQDDDLGASLNKVAASFVGMMQTSKEQMRVLIENLQSKDKNESLQPKDVNESLSKDKNESQQSKGNNESLQSKDNRTGQLRSELIKLGLSITDRVKALRLLMADTWNADFFLTLDEEEKLEFVKQLIDESSKK